MKYFIKCGKLFDGLTEDWKEHVNILVEDKIIKAVGPDLCQPDDAELVDLSHLSVTPGLIDAHVHFDFIGPNVSGTVEAHMTSDEMKAFNILYNAQRGLEGGFTTIRVIGTSLNTMGAIDARNVIEKGMFHGARLVVAPNSLTTTGGHTDRSAYFRSNFRLSEAYEGISFAQGNGPDFFRQLVRKQVKYGADLIKIMATGGFASPYDGPEDCQMDDDELKAIINTAKALKTPVTAHAYTADLIENLVKLGISGIEHGSMMSLDNAKQMKDNGVYLVPTFMPYQEIVHLDEEKLALKHPAFREKLIKYADRLRESRQIQVDLIHENQLTIGYGTDMVRVYNNFECWREFKVWREEGISALRTLRAATSVNAEIVNRPMTGSIVPGKFADIAAWSRDIDNDFEAISECDFVMKEGVIYKS